MVKQFKSKPELFLEKRKTKRKTYYLVKWTDQTLQHATWVSTEHLEDCHNVKKVYKTELRQSASTKARSSAHSNGANSPQSSVENPGNSPVVCRQLTYADSPKFLRSDVPLSIKKLVRERKSLFVEVDWGKRSLDSKIPIMTAKRSFPRKLIEFMVAKIK